MIGYLVLALVALFTAAYLIGRRRALASVSGEISKLHSLPGHHGLFLGLAAAGPALIAVARMIVSRVKRVERVWRGVSAGAARTFTDVGAVVCA